MANDGSDGNALQSGFLKTVQDELFSKFQVWLGNLVNFAQMLLQYEIRSGNCFLSFWLFFFYSVNVGNVLSIYKSFE